MTIRRLALAAASLLPLGAAALDGPHSGVFGEDCLSCHTLHNAPGVSLTSNAGNPNLCLSCHNKPGRWFGGWNETTAQAVPGVSGHSHSWSAPANGLGATPPPLATPMGDRLTGGKLQCSTCHDQHNYDESAGGAQHVTPVARVVGTSGTVTLGPVPPSAIARGYLLQIVTEGDVGVATFRISHDGRTWLGWNGSAWAPGVATGRATGAPVSLDDPAGLDVEFAGTFATGDRFRFNVGQAFLRIPNTEAAMCTTCHKDLDHSLANARGEGPLRGTGGEVTLGTTYFSHPVGEVLNANGLGHDRAPGAILDAHGQPQQGSPDGIATNDLKLSAGTERVTCLTCHAPHQADSNSLTEDTR